MSPTCKLKTLLEYKALISLKFANKDQENQENFLKIPYALCKRNMGVFLSLCFTNVFCQFYLLVRVPLHCINLQREETKINLRIQRHFSCYQHGMHLPPPLAWGRIKNICWEVLILLRGGGGGDRIFNENLKLHNPSINIFGITSLIYFILQVHQKYPLIFFIRYTTLRFLVFPFFYFSSMASVIALSLLYGKHPDEHNQQCIINQS